MLSFLGKIKKTKNIVKLGGLIILLLLAFNGFKGGFFLAQAFDSKINIYPGDYRLEQNDDSFFWSGIPESFFQDLFQQSDYEDFTQSNSAFISPLLINELNSSSTDSILKDNLLASSSDLYLLEGENDEASSSEESIEFDNNGEVLGIFDDSFLTSTTEEYTKADFEDLNQESIVEAVQTEEESIISEENIFDDNSDSQDAKQVIEETDPIQENVQIEDFFQEPVPEIIPLPVVDEAEKQIEPVQVPESDSGPVVDDASDTVSWLKSRFKIAVSYFDLKNVLADKKKNNKNYDINNDLQSLIFSDFTVPVDYKNGDIGDIIVNFSLSAFSEYEDARLLIDYRIGEDWESLDEINLGLEKIYNSKNGSFFEYNLPNEVLWRDIDDLEIRISYFSPDKDFREDKEIGIFLDAIWLEVNYSDDPLDSINLTEEIVINSLPEDDTSYFEKISVDDLFEVDENPEFRFKYQRKNKGILKKISSSISSLFTDNYKNIEIRAELEAPNKEKSKINTELKYLENGEFQVLINKDKREFIPGKYRVEIIVKDGGNTYSTFQDFSWGVLALNANKSIYLNGEIAYLQMGVLDDGGHTICDADLYLEITDPRGVLTNFNTDNGLLARNPECGPDNVIENPDYYTFYSLSGLGEYKLRLRAVTENGEWEITDKIEVQEELPLEIERIGPTRIYPKAIYKMEFRVRANEDYRGEFREIVPNGFDIVGGEGIFTRDLGDAKELSWTVDWRAGETYDFFYAFDAPDRSPEFYLLGPARTDNFTEIRQWQIANDAPTTRAKTVIFEAGIFSGDGTTGQNSDTNQTFSAFNFSLAEKNVSIKNAFVMLETQFEAYANLGGNWTGYDLAFDACLGSACANAFAGSGNIVQTDATNLAYAETESNQMRILADVTSEVQLAAYTGDGSQMEAQVGYDIQRGTIINTISNAKALLYITYTYDYDSPSITNTVVYPLDSTNSSDRGTRQASLSSCTLDSNCSLFDYRVEAPELSTSLSQWFSLSEQNDGNAGTDIYVDVNIEGTDIDSSTYVHESVNGGTQGHMPTMNFTSVPGYLNNASSTLEYHSYNSGTHYLIGGEVFETYTASSSASIKTRTVSFPLGALNNGLDTSSSSQSVDVYFPENGALNGNVQIQKAWFRIIGNDRNSGAFTLGVVSRVGNNATSSALSYSYNGGGTVIKPSFSVINIIPESDYAELALANGTSSKTVTLETISSNAASGLSSAELMITYTYTDEAAGYLTNIQLFGGQQSTNGNSQSESISTANSVLPETSKKTILAGGLLTSYLLSDSDGAIANAEFVFDSNVATVAPSCSNTYSSRPDSVNAFMQYYKDVSSALNTTNNQTYTACYTNNGAGDASAGAKVNGILIYTYSYYDPPSLIITPNNQFRSDGATVISNGGWAGDTVELSTFLTNATTSNSIDYYFELLERDGTFASTTPGTTCPDGTAYSSCSSKIWKDTSGLAPDGWYDENWGYRKKITINASQVVSDETGFVILATTTDLNLRHTSAGGNVAHVQGFDFVVTDSNGTTTLAYDRSYYASSTGDLIIWIKTDISSSANKDIYLYYGNTNVSVDQANPSGTWDNGFEAVWHLNESPSGTLNEIVDSTGNGNDGTGYGSMGAGNQISAQVGDGLNFNGSSNYIALNSSFSGANAIPEMTVCTWFNTSFSGTAYNDNWAFLDYDRSEFFDFYLAADTNSLEFSTTDNGAGGIDDFQANTTGLNDGNWHYACAVYDGTDKIIYLNGNPDGTRINPHAGNGLGTAASTRYGFIADGSEATSFNGARNNIWYEGDIDELQFSTTARSANWIKTQYNNQSDQANFVSFDTEETMGNLEGRVQIISIPDSLTGYKWQVMACNDGSDCSVWKAFNTSPNFIVDGTLPLAPGDLSLSSQTDTSVVLNFGFQATETNFDTYKIFYKKAVSGVSETDSEHIDSNLSYINYNGYSTTEITGLDAGSQYVFNIWVYDLAGNKASALEMTVTTGDAPRARTVEYLAGSYSADGTTGQNSDTSQTFSSFDIKLGEDSTNIRSAYIVYEAQFEAYASLNNFIGYELAFDSCMSPCTPNAFSGSGNILKDDNNILVYSESESNIIRLLLDVTNEVQLDSYSGGGQVLKGQVGYNLQKGSASNSIANSRAKLVVTYTFEETSSSITNTVSYPLESTGAGDSGTMRSSFVDCTLNSSCPTFSYNMEIPEYAVSPSSEKLSQWFTTHNINDATGIGDISIDVNIQGTDVNSSMYIHEAVLGAGQSNIQNIYFDSVSGYSENTSQTLEYRATSPDVGAYYLAGGEVTETYIASSSATEKTRTISFPIGVLNNGLSITQSKGQVDVYFPENGTKSGNVTIKKAWYRITSVNNASAANTITVSTKTGVNATSSSYVYNYNTNGSVPNPTFRIIHIVPSLDYSELELANAIDPKTMTITTENSNVTQQGGTFAELVITYTYSDETSGYLANLKWFAGQTDSAGNTQSATTSVSGVVFPEDDADKTLLAAGLLANYIYSDSDGGVATGYDIRANLALASPDCSTPNYSSYSDGTNAFAEIMVDISSSLTISHNQDYVACFSNDGGGDASGGAKMNGQLVYTYQYYNPPPITLTVDNQFKADQLTSITNNTWTNEDEVYLSSYASDISASTTQIDFYYNLVGNSSSFSTASSTPASSCSDGVAFAICTPKIWKVSDTVAGAASWYDSNWLYRKALTINASQVTANETDFPVLATSTHSDFAHTSFGGNVASSSGADILITASDGTTVLDYEREHYSSTTGELILWIKTDISSTTNTELYIYYGNSSVVSDQATTTGVWTNNFQSVWHMNQSLSGASDEFVDSSGNGADGTSFGGMDSTNLVDTKIGQGYNFNGTSDYIALNSSYTGTGAIPEMTACAWFNTSFSSAGWNDNWALLDFDRSEFFDLYVNADDGTIGYSTNVVSTIDDFDGNTAGLNDGTWHYTCAVYNGTDKIIYVDGDPDGTRVNAHGGASLGEAITRYGIIGDGSEAGTFNGAINGFYYSGYMDEIVYSEVTRSANWIKTTYNNQSDPDTFVTFSSIEQTESSINYIGLANVTAIPDSGAGYKWQVMSCNNGGDCSIWKNFGVPANFFVDSTPPTAPGNLGVSTTTATSITLNFGGQSTETNFTEYKIFYKQGLSGVDENDIEHTDSNMNFIDYNSTATTTIAGLEADSQYVINIWAYDIAGNKTSATEILVNTATAPHARGRTVIFPAGEYSGDRITGQNTDTDYTFSTFNFELAETDVEIRDAYILFEAQIEAYVNNANNYTGYDLAFDVCAEPCTASAFSGVDTVEKNDVSILAYNESESNQIRLLLNVTNEVQLNAYTGDSSQLEAQVGYNIQNGLTANSIASAKAKLFVTYAYNGDDSSTLTNTVIYPLESTSSGDSGSRRILQVNNCTLNSDCPIFTYNMDIPEFNTRLNQWFEMYMTNDVSTDVTVNVNIEGSDVNSDTFIHEEALGGEQSALPMMIFSDVFGFTENFNQSLEFYQQGSTAYMMGGEVYETYTYPSSATTKTRTVSFPMGVITNGQSTSLSSGSVDIYFPENGSGSGIVNIKKAWFRIKGNNSNTSLYNITVSSKAGNNATSSDYVYSIDAGGAVVKPTFDVIHVIPSADYSEIELANASVPKEIKLNTSNSNVIMGGVSAELMITYAYTDESSGYLSSISLFGGQSGLDSNAQSDSQFTGESVFPELRGNETVRAAGLRVSNLVTDSDFGVPSSFASFDTILSTSTATATPAFYSRTDSINAFVEYYKNVFGSIDSSDKQTYVSSFANNGSGDSSAGAKMNAQLSYTYQWDAPPTELTQNDWRWYENIDAVQPTTALANAKTSISAINIGDTVRLRMNLGVSKEDMSASTQSFKLQYGLGSDCTVLASWSDVDSVGGTGAWAGYNNPAPADGVNLSASLLASSTVTQTYEESNSSKNNPNSVPKNEYSEWDWVIYNNSATSSVDYCFRMIKADGINLDDYLSDSYPKLTTASANTLPADSFDLSQWRNDEITEIPNAGWIDESEVRLVASVNDPNIDETLTLYFELVNSAGSFTTATSEPSGACIYGTAYSSCATNIWFSAAASPGDFRVTPYIGTTSITAIPESAAGYKWQVMACDDDAECSSWISLGGNPNFRSDLNDPTPPGSLSFAQVNATGVVLTFGATTTETNFASYKIFYKVGTTGVSESDLEHGDANMNFIDFNGATSTTLNSLSAGTDYVFNIWAYDQVGHSSSSVAEISTTTVSSFTPPTGAIFTATQKTDGSGIVDMVVRVDDPDNDDSLRIKMEFVSGAACDFTTPLDPSLDETDENITAVYGDPDIDNNSSYQIGTSTSWIITSPGENYVLYDWQTKSDIPVADGTHCIRTTINDGMFDQTSPTTFPLIIDNVAPTTPGALTLSQKDFDSVILTFGSASTDSRFDEYRIYYAEGTQGVSESDSLHTDTNLSYINYNGATSTEITALTPNTNYVFNIWAYDTLGNRASSTQVAIKTNAVPANITANAQYKSDGLAQILNGAWTDDSGVVLSASAHDQDVSDLVTFYYEVITNATAFSTDSGVPSGACNSGDDYGTCGTKMWAISTTTSSLPSDWYDRDWLYRKQITIESSQILIDDNNFSVLVQASDTDLANSARTDGFDILFTDSSGTTTLPYEREDFNSATGDLNAWVKTSVSSTTDTIIYMYYGNVGASTDNATTTNIWDSNYVSVWHLDEDVVDESSELAVHRDSVGNNDGDQYGNNEITGQIANGQEFGGNDYINIPDDNSLDLSSSITLSAWMDVTSGSAWNYSRSITLSPSTPEDDYQIEVVLSSSDFDYGKTDTNGDDLRFYDSSNNLLDYYIDNWNIGGTSTIWVKVINSGTSFITMKYGNSLALPLSNATSTFVFYDDFEDNDISDWTTYASGLLSVYSGGVDGSTYSVEKHTNTDPNGGYIAYTPSLSDFEFIFNTNKHAVGSGAQTRLGIEDSSYNGYSIQLTDPAGGAGNLCIETRTAGTGSNCNIATQAVSTSMNTWYEMRFRRYGTNNLEVDFMDADGLVLLQSTSGTDSTYTSGFDRVIIHGGEPFLIDDVRLRKYSTNDPVITVGSEMSVGINKTGAYSITSDTSTSTVSVNNSSLSAGISSGWNLITMTYDSAATAPQEKMYVNGVLVATSTYSSAITTNTSDLVFGNAMVGNIDEVTISNIARSAEYIETQYNNQKNPGTFISFASESRVTSYFETALVLNIPDASTGYKWQVKACDDDGDCSAWESFGTSSPNFLVDTLVPTAPGALSSSNKTSTSITLSYGAQTSEANFSEYRIFYSSTTPVYETNTEIDNTDLDYIDYNGSSITTLSALTPDTNYYFNIWAYDAVGHKASSSVTLIKTNAAVSSPGAIFYTKNTRTLFYKVWDGSNWGAEQAGPTFGSAAGDNIRHIRTERSDDGGKISILVKTWDGANQEWWASVYRFVANDFVNTTQLGAALGSATNAQIMTACMASISGGEFFIVKSNGLADGTIIYTWDVIDGWAYDNTGPNPVARMNGCTLVRRPGTDNYLLVTHDDDADVGTAYYTGGANYSDTWTAWTQHAAAEDDSDNFAPDAFFDPSDNTRGAISYSDSTVNWYGQAKFFVVDASSINYGSTANMPTAWTDDFVHGEFASDPGGTGVAYYAGRDIDNRLSVLKLDISGNNISWSEISSGTDIASTNLYQQANDSQKPFDIIFYRSGEGIVSWNSRLVDTPYYRYFQSSSDTVDAVNTAVPGATSDLWVRARTFNDPNEEEFITIYQNDNVDYAAVFFDGASDKFYNSVDHPTSNQVWTTILASSGALDRDDEAVSFSYASYNSPPSNPSSMIQYKTDASSTVANLGWTNESTIKLETKVSDSDTDEVLKVYLELLPIAGTFTSSTSEPTGTCSLAIDYSTCASKIWSVATSTAGDYSLNPFTATATITAIPDSDTGYKWQVITCDDEVECSAWTVFNAVTPNFKVDTNVPNVFGDLSIASLDSQSITLNYGSATVDSNFLEYRIFYKIGSSGALETDTEHDDTDLDYINYNSQSGTAVLSLASSTQYVFNIWAYDLAGNKISATEISTTTSAGPNLEQTSYILENDNGATVNTNTLAAAIDTALTGIYIGERVNARIQIENNGGDIQSNTVYKLQFENQTDSPGTWLDVNASTEISYSSGLSGSNGDQITSAKAALNASTWVFGTWHDGTNLSGSYSLDYGEYSEFVFAIETSNALVNKTYRLRLYNNTDSKALNTYTSYPTISTTLSDVSRYSKDSLVSLGTGIGDLAFYLDPIGYTDVSLNDDVDKDSIITLGSYPVYNFATKHTNNTDAITVNWDGQSSVGPANKTVYLQVYKYGSPNQWVTVASNNTAATSTDFSFSSNLNSDISSYYDGSNWIYWRVYQESDSQTFETDYYNIAFSAPTSDARQIHYRWREDDGSQTTATWREVEDVGDPTGATLELNPGENIRLRMEVANSGGGTATNYNYQIEYASTPGDCSSDPGGWATVTTDESGHWNMSTSTNFADGDPTTAQLFNTEAYSFVAGDMVEYLSVASGNITLTEDDYTELEYVIRATSNSNSAGTYCFRMTDSGSVLDAYDIYPVITLAGNTNNAPYFTVLPSDTGSASTSPTNYGTNVSFTATAQDDDVGDDYYLAVCKTNAVVAGNDAPPSCTAGDWCISNLASSTAEASCDYSTAEADEELDWYAFACDKHAGFSIAKCSAVSQGSGATDASPFVINHPPVLTSVNTDIDNQDPGSVFNFSTVSSDTDVSGGADTVDLYICYGTSAAYGVGCAGGASDTVCSVIATTSANISCSYSDIAPSPSGATTYNVFLFDENGMAANNNYLTSSYSINNVAPILGSLVLNSGSDITLNLGGAPDTQIQTINASIVDQNGCDTGLVSAVATIYMSGASGGSACTSNDSDCYQINTANCVKNNCTGDDDDTASYVCTADMKYFAAPTDISIGNPWESHNWLSYLNVYDGSNYSATTSAAVELITSTALDVPEDVIDFGSDLFVGENSGTDNSTTTVVNIGNSPIDASLSGTDMAGNPSGSIGVSNMEWSLSGGFSWSSGSDLTTVDTGVNIVASNPISSTEVSDNIYWGIGIPFGADASIYYGQNDFSVSLDNDDWQSY